MQSKFLLEVKWLAYILIVLPLCILGMYFLLDNGEAIYRELNISKVIASIEKRKGVSSPSVGYGLPVRLVIPKVNLVSNIEHVGVTSIGIMDTPKNIRNVAWYRSGVRPGEVGSAVIVGHYGWLDNKVSAFDRLSEIKIGDNIYIEDENGFNIIFTVRKIKRYEKDADTRDIFSSTDGLSHVNLITCTGAWNVEDNSYSSRLVVFTDREVVQ